jgi:phospholipid/cholesterol/gamma-HCH transport system substrate-binding protein
MLNKELNKHNYWWYYPIVRYRIWAKRRRIGKMSKDVPMLYYSIVFSVLLLLFSSWFFLHPNSPWHSRNHYIVAFKEIGNLKIGNAVNVNGLPKGYVEKFELTDSCVWTKVAVLSKVKIPMNSSFRLVNVGLMGERVVEITLGDSKKYYASNSRIRGNFDAGSTTVGELAVEILKEASDIVDILSDLADTLFSEQKMKDYKRLTEKGKKLGNKVSRFASSAEHSARASIDSLVEAKEKLAEILDKIKPNINGAIENTDLLSENFANLEKSLEAVKNSIASIAEILERGENTISLALNKNQKGDLRREILKVFDDAENLMEKIKRRGLDLNAVIWK